MDVLCLISKWEIIPKSMLNDVSGSFSEISIVEMAILGPMFMTVLLFVMIDIFFGLRETFCTSEKNRDKHLKPALFYAILNKVMPFNDNLN